MIRAIWDWLFVRRQWEIVHKAPLIDEKGDRIGIYYVLKDQFGNIKKRSLRA